MNLRIALIALTSVLVPIMAHAADAPEKRQSFKGWELYSWKDGSKWRYSLLVGTNRTKFCSEVKDEKSVKTLEQLETSLAELKPAEWVTWERAKAPNLSDPCELSLPPADVVKRVKDLAKKLDISLHVVE